MDATGSKRMALGVLPDPTVPPGETAPRHTRLYRGSIRVLASEEGTGRMASEDEVYDELSAFMAGEAAVDSAAADLPPAADAEQANAYLRARQRLLGDAARVAAVVDAEVKRLFAFREDRMAGINERVAHLERLLEGWMRAVNADDPRRKTEVLPNGELRLRGPAWRVEVTDEAALVAWLWANDPGLLDVKFPPKVGELKGRVATDPAKHADRPFRLAGAPVGESDVEAWWEVVTGDGEAIPGVRLAKERRDRFSVKP